MIYREQLLAISELHLAEKIEQMDDGKLDNFVQLLNSFTDNLPVFEKKINKAIVEMDYDDLSKTLSSVRDMLKKIYAEEMAQECTKQIEWIGSVNHKKLEAYMRYFLANLSLLSSDIQKAEQQSEALAAAKKVSRDENGDASEYSEDINIDKGRLLAITELNIAEKIEQMNEDSLKNYAQLLDSFTENFPDQEEEINAALKAKDNDALTKQLSDVRDILAKIYADEMAQECTKQIGLIGSIKQEKTEAYMRYFLASLSMLSLDIQLALHKIDATAYSYAKSGQDVGTRNKRILAVDDTAFFLTILKKELQGTKYKLTCVASGRDALKYIEKYHVDLFFLDIEMPGMDGFELAAKIRERGHKKPIIFLTGNARKENLAKAMKAGATDFIIKPINKDILISKLRKYI